MWSADELQAIDDVRREPLTVWGGRTVWVWGVTFRQFMALNREAQRFGPDGLLVFDAERYAICRVIECVRESGDVGARPVFRREEHYEWLLDRDAQTVDRILRLSMRLSGEEGGPGPCADPLGSGEETSSPDSSSGSAW